MKILDDRQTWFQEFQAGWLDHWQKHHEYNWKIYNRPRNTSEISGKGVDLSQSRFMLISTAGGYIKDEQEPFDAPNPLGDYSVRVFPSNISLDALAFAHDHYDHTAVNEDPQVLIPLYHLQRWEADGRIAELAQIVVSFMGYQPDVTRVLDEIIPEIISIAKQEQIDAALLVPS